MNSLNKLKRKASQVFCTNRIFHTQGERERERRGKEEPVLVDAGQKSEMPTAHERDNHNSTG